MRVSKILFGTLLVGILASSMVLAGVTQSMQGSVKRIGFVDVFGPNCDGTLGADCTIHYDYWSDVESGEINRGATSTGVPTYTLRGNPLGSRRSDYMAALANIGDYPVSGASADKNWFLAFFGELNGDSVDHIGYYTAEAQVVSFGEFGNANILSCIGSFPVACFSSTAPPAAPAPHNVAHSVFRADGSEVKHIGGLSPIPIPRASLDAGNLLINLEWDAAAGQLATDGAPNPIVGYRVYMFQDTVGDQVLTSSVAGDMVPLAVEDVAVPATSLAVSLFEDIDPLTEGVFFAIQLIYVSTPSPFDAFQRRSGFTQPNGSRVEGLSANSNGINIALDGGGAIQNFSGVRPQGNRVTLSWDVPDAADFAGAIDSFDVLVSKSAEGLDIGNIPAKLAGGVLSVPFDPAVTSYSVEDRNAGRTGSKINIYILRANLSDGTSLLSRPIVVDLTGVL